MSIRGVRIPFFGKPIATAGGENRAVKLFPVQEEVANGRLGLLGQWSTRPGYEIHLNLPTTAPVVLLVEHQGLVAVTGDGKVFRSRDENFRAARELPGRLTGHSRPMACIHDGALIIADGGDLSVVESNKVRKAGIPRQAPGAPTVSAIGNRGDVPEASWVYALTYTTVAGESLLGEASAAATKARGVGGFRVTAPELTDEERRWVLTWSVYRRLESGKAWGLVGTAPLGTPYIEDLLAATTTEPPTTDGSASAPPAGITDVATVGDYLVFGGHDSTEIGWSNPGSHDYFPAANTTNVQLDGGFFQGLRGNGKDLLVFRTTMTDLYALTGGLEVFLRRQPIRRGCAARKSIVLVDGIIPYWLGDDGIFYRLEGVTPKAIGELEQDFILSLRSPESLRGEWFPLERVVRWFSDPDGICIGYNYGKQHFFRDWTWDGRRRQQLPIQSTITSGNLVLVGLDAGQIGEWSDEHTTDAGRRIRTIRRFTLPMTGDGKQARANALLFRHDRGTREIRTPLGIRPWRGFTEYFVGDIRTGLEQDQEDRMTAYRCILEHTSGGTTTAPGYPSGTWPTYWRRLRPDDLYEIIVRWGFDQGSQAGEERIGVGSVGDTQPYAVIGPCGFGREIWVEVERAASVPAQFTGGALVAQPLGDGL